ncbi:MAG: diguanylate cyclase, partial [Micromonosporaceae bacterium]|nr:diguanylate cyclase [Micromonosporaceae bacterium]
DITPANVLWAGSDRLTLIDFDLATTAAEDRPGFTHEHAIIGTLAYLAPEQTGRTGRPVDQRADLYGLGATLYELATGAPPFEASDPLRLVHAHLAEVPAAPVDRNPTIPTALSEIILRLLEKQPDRRYQSGEGLAHDLRLVREAWSRGERPRLVLGERDFPLRLSAPSRLIGRDAEIAVLEAALRESLAGRQRGLLISGVPGVGKTALLNQLRPLVTRSGGWFVLGKFDQYHQGQEADAVRQVLRALGRLYLAAPEGEIVALRARVLDVLGPNAGLIAALLPEFATLLDVAPQAPTGDPLTLRARVTQAGLSLVRAIATPQRPLAIAIDDLQWGGPTPLDFVDALLADEELCGVLLVCSYRKTEVDATHPLAAMLARWQRLPSPPALMALHNLPAPALGTLLGEMLRISLQEASPLAEVIGARTEGNPYDTVELVNALRRDGALAPGTDGWQWEAATLRRYLGQGDVVDLLSSRMEALPRDTLDLLGVMACLGGEIDLDLLCVASGRSCEVVEDQLRAAFEDGLAVSDSGECSVSFRHDRVQQAAFGRLVPVELSELRLALARRLAAVPQYHMQASEQYLTILDEIRDPAEQARLIALFRAGAARARAAADHTKVEQFVSAAEGLIAPAGPVPVDPQTAAELAIERHAALYSLGRLAEADAAYQRITELTSDPLALARAAQLQISSLVNQNRPQEAMALGLDLLGRLGVPEPGDPEALAAEIERGMARVDRWISSGGETDDLGRQLCTDPRVLAIGDLIDRMIPPAFFCGHPTMPWLFLVAARMWEEHGPARALAGPHCYASFITIGLREDYQTGNTVVRRVLAFSESQGYEPETSHIRAAYALSCAPWFEPLEDGIRQAHQAHEGLVRGGALQFACHTYYTTLPFLFDCAATLDEVVAEAEVALAFTARTGNDHAAETYRVYRQFAEVCSGRIADDCGLTTGSFNEVSHFDGLEADPTAVAYIHVMHAVAAAIFGNTEALVRHATAVGPLMPYISATYITVLAHLTRALAAASRIGPAGPEGRQEAVREFEVERDWLAARAEDAPGSLGHLVRWVEAERAWAVGDVLGALRWFDAALSALAQRSRPWHRAAIAERCALFHLANGFEYGAMTFLGQARASYDAWGATVKVDDLDRRYPGLRRAHPGGTWLAQSTRLAQSARLAQTQRWSADSDRSGTYSVEAIDLLGVINASQALSSETHLDRLRARVASILSAMTGATSVLLAMLDDSRSWFLPADDSRPLPLDAAAERGLIPLSAFRYAERTREPLIIDDATGDERFRRDPYFADLDCCSLLVIPILTRGSPRAMLLLENRLSRAAFTPARLDGVMLIAGQLAVSLDNALLYASLERKVAERTQALGQANERLETLSITDALTGLANRRRLTEVLEDEWQRALQEQVSLAVAMIDIDHFKPFNDHYGHPAGDQCLRRVAATLADNVRGTDLVARYGGEEFVIVMPGVGLTIAERVAHRVRSAVAALDQPHEYSPFGFVTISVGVTAMTPAEQGSVHHLVEFADHLLYQAKRNGRNRVEVRKHQPIPNITSPHLESADKP